MIDASSGGNSQVSNRQLYEALMDIQRVIADIRVQLAGLPCREHAHAMDEWDSKLRDVKTGYKAADETIKADYQQADRDLKTEIGRKQVAWTGGGVASTLAAIAAWLGFRG